MESKTCTEKSLGPPSGPLRFPLRYSSRKPSFKESFASVISMLKDKRNIIVLTGAGISVSCGIPDFRSRGFGLYETLDTNELGLSCPEELFDWDFFQEDPRPFYKFARNLYFPLGADERVRPSDSHKLLAMLEQRKMLLRVYSQNIDGLEQVSGVSSKKIVYAHGSLQWATCLKCNRKVSASEIEPDILKGTVAYCLAPSTAKGNSLVLPLRDTLERTRKRSRSDESATSVSSPAVCGGVLKPNVTFFGETLHDNVRRCLEADREKVDALIVMGTSLSVAPISKVIGYLPPNIPRILINRTIVHPAKTEDEVDEDDRDFRTDYVFDAYLLGFCDDVTRALAKQLFAKPDSEPAKELHNGRILSTLKEGDMYSGEDWSSVTVPREQVLLFPGAQATKMGEDSVEVTYREIAHCDGCTKRIRGTILKCSTCFDYDLCEVCFPSLLKTHYEGTHMFCKEAASNNLK